MTETTLTIAVLVNLVLTGWLLGIRIYERREAKRLARLKVTQTAQRIAEDRALLDRVEKENLSGPANPAVTAMIASNRTVLEDGEPMSAANRTFVVASVSQLTDINDFISTHRVAAELERRTRGKRS